MLRKDEQPLRLVLEKRAHFEIGLPNHKLESMRGSNTHEDVPCEAQHDLDSVEFIAEVCFDQREHCRVDCHKRGCERPMGKNLAKQASIDQKTEKGFFLHFSHVTLHTG